MSLRAAAALCALCAAAAPARDVLALGDAPVFEGALAWPLATAAATAAAPLPPARFSVHRALATPAEVAALRALLASAELDADPDSVDSLATHEIYLERSGGAAPIAKIAGKPDADAATFRRRQPLRAALAAITAPIVAERVLPLVNARYARECAVDGVEGRCRVCHSLARRFHDGERAAHPTHFDVQALVTVVIPLSTFGADFEGGLYVSTGAGYAGEERFLPLAAGDAVVHQSTLLHGVSVSSGERWSWILWLKNAREGRDCEAVDASQWTAAAAAAGDPLAQFLHARRARGAAERAAWLLRAAEGGFMRAANEIGQALVEGAGVARNESEGRRWLAAAAAAGEPEALHNLGLLEARGAGGNATRAVALFREAAERGLAAAAANVGVAFYNGRGVAKDLAAAAQWFERAGDERSMLLAAQIAQHLDDVPAALRILARAARGGSKDAAARLARAKAGGEEL